jgi:hypothetical protein
MSAIDKQRQQPDGVRQSMTLERGITLAPAVTRSMGGSSCNSEANYEQTTRAAHFRQ